MNRHRLPLWLKLAYTAWFIIWVPVYWVENGPANFLWLCDVANIVVLVALWRESALLFSSQAVSVLLIQFAWIVDVVARLAAGVHPIGGTEYMFAADTASSVKLLSLFHLFMPAMLLWAVWRLGHDRRGWKLQCLIAWVVLPLSYLAAPPEDNLNWLWSPFGIDQVWLPPVLFLVFCMLAYPLVLFLPTHALLAWWMRRMGRPIMPV